MPVKELWQKFIAANYGTQTMYVHLSDGTVYREDAADALLRYLFRHGHDEREGHVVQAYAVNQNSEIINLKNPDQPIDENQVLWIKLRSVPYDKL